MSKLASQIEAIRSEMRSDKKFAGSLILTALIVVIGTAMHFVGLPEKYPWFDEAATVNAIACVDENKIRGQILSQGEVMDLLKLDSHNRGVAETLEYNRKVYSDHVPLYFVLLKPYAMLFGSTIASLRTFSALWSVLIPPLFFWLILELSGSKRTALIGTAIISVSPFCMLYSAEARNYTFWLVLAIANFIFLWRLSVHRTLIQALASGALLAMAASCHLATLSLVPGQVLFLLIKRVPLRMIALTFIPAVIAVVGFLIYQGESHRVLGQVTYKSWASMTIDKNYWLQLGEVLLSRIFFDNGQDTQGILAFTILSVLFAVGCFFVKSMTSARRAFLFCMFSSALIVFAMDVVLGGMRTVVSRYQAVPIVTVYIAAALVIEFLLSQPKKLPKICGTLLLVLIIACGFLSEWKIANAKELWNHWQPVDVAETVPVLQASKHPLLLSYDSEIQIAMAHFVPAHTRLELIKKGNLAIPPDIDLVVICSPKSVRAKKLFDQLKASYPDITVLR